MTGSPTFQPGDRIVHRCGNRNAHGTVLRLDGHRVIYTDDLGFFASAPLSQCEAEHVYRESPPVRPRQRA